jgi:hypothetical protein
MANSPAGLMSYPVYHKGAYWDQSFFYFINDLDGAALLIEILRKFADDTKLGQTVGTDQDKEKLQQALDNQCDWADKWGMEFNIKKCKIMHLGHNNPGHVYTMKNQQLETTEIERDIGVNVSNSLKPGGQNGPVSTVSDFTSLPLQRSPHFQKALRTICETTP